MRLLPRCYRQRHVPDTVLTRAGEIVEVSRRPKQKPLTAVPTKFDPDFAERLSKRYSLTRIVQERREALEAHWGGGDLS